MQYPAAGEIEMAIDALAFIDPEKRELQQKGFREALGAACNDDLLRGYEIGLQTARVLLAGIPGANVNL